MLTESDLEKYFSDVAECKHYRDCSPNDGLVYPPCYRSSGLYRGVCLLPLKEECLYVPEEWLEEQKEKLQKDNQNG